MNTYPELVSEASVSARTEFYKRTYLHVALAILAFMALETCLIRFLPVEWIGYLIGGGYTWLFIIGLFWLGSFLANKFAFAQSKPTQYAGLLLYVLIEAIIFLPMIYIASSIAESDVLMSAAVLTLSLFGGMTAMVFMSGYDFSFLRTGIVIGGFIALGLVVIAVIFGFNLGTWFSLVMILLASASILYQTSQIKDHYATDQYVGASLQIFASIMLLFWYILRLFLDRD